MSGLLQAAVGLIALAMDSNLQHKPLLTNEYIPIGIYITQKHNPNTERPQANNACGFLC